MSQESSPLETALDLLVYAPVGFALTLSEEVPKLAAKGRSRVEGQIAAARVIGQLAVGQGRRLVTRAAPASPRPQARSTPMRPATESPPAPPAARGARTAPRTVPRPRPPAGAGRGPAGDTQAPPAVASLAIPGYDSLSASQVVQRLDGLSRDELEAVRRYEASGRGRRTILARVSQLQSG